MCGSYNDGAKKEETSQNMVSNRIPSKCRAQVGHVAAFCSAHAFVVPFFGGGTVAQTLTG